MIRSTRRLVALATGGTIAALVAVPSLAPAVVPPRDCGRMTVSQKRYQVKVDQITCSSGRSFAKRYIARRSKPRGYKCKQFPSKRNRVRFYCNNGKRVFFAIRR